jgi:hypothetical protein
VRCSETRPSARILWPVCRSKFPIPTDIAGMKSVTDPAQPRRR